MEENAYIFYMNKNICICIAYKNAYILYRVRHYFLPGPPKVWGMSPKIKLQWLPSECVFYLRWQRCRCSSRCRMDLIHFLSTCSPSDREVKCQTIAPITILKVNLGLKGKTTWWKVLTWQNFIISMLIINCKLIRLMNVVKCASEFSFQCPAPHTISM